MLIHTICVCFRERGIFLGNDISAIAAIKRSFIVYNKYVIKCKSVLWFAQSPSTKEYNTNRAKAFTSCVLKTSVDTSFYFYFFIIFITVAHYPGHMVVGIKLREGG